MSEKLSLAIENDALGGPSHDLRTLEQPPFEPKQFVRIKSSGTILNVARCEKRVVHGALRWVVDDLNGMRAFASDCELIKNMELVNAETGQAVIHLEPQPEVRYACSKLAAVGDTVQIAGPNLRQTLNYGTLIVENVEEQYWVSARDSHGTLRRIAAGQLEFVPEVTLNKPRDFPLDPVCELELEQTRQRLAVAKLLLGQCGATFFIVGPFELRLKEGGWKIYRPATEKYLVDANEQTVWPDVFSAYVRAKELNDAAKGGVA